MGPGVAIPLLIHGGIIMQYNHRAMRALVQASLLVREDPRPPKHDTRKSR